MKFTFKIQDTNSPFYKACRDNGQSMGMAIPYLLSSDASLFKMVNTEAGSVLEDLKGKTYKTHFGNGKRFNVAPSYMKGHGRSINVIGLESFIRSFDYHLFAHQNGDEIVCDVLSSKDVYNKTVENGDIFFGDK